MLSIRHFLLALVSVFLFFFTSCKKDDDKTVTPASPTTTQTVTFDKSSVTPGDVVVVTTATDLDPTKSNWEIRVGGRTVQLAKLEARQAAFVIPMVASGPLALDMTAVGIPAPPTLTMASYALIANPDQVITDFGNSLTAALTHLDQMAQDSLAPTPAQDVALVRSLQQQLNTAQAGLTAAQKLEAAFALQKMTFDGFDFAAIPPRRLTGDPADDLIRLGQQLAVKMTFVALATDVFMVTVVSPDPLSKFVAVAATITAIYQMVQVYKLLGRIADRFDMIESIDLLGSGPSGSFVILTNNPSNFTLSATGRTLTTGDAGASPGLQIIFATERTFSRLRQSFDNKYNQVRSWLGAANAALTPYVNPIRQAAQRRKRVMAANLVRISNVSNSAISVVATALNNTLALRASSSTVSSTPIPFTFDVTYANTALGINARRTINASVTNVDSTAIYVASMVGEWSNLFLGGNPVRTEHMFLNANGTGYYVTSGVQYANSWRVSRTSTGYYFSESGYWHPVFNGSAHTRLRLPMRTFKAFDPITPSIVSHVYTKI